MTHVRIPGTAFPKRLVGENHEGKRSKVGPQPGPGRWQTPDERGPAWSGRPSARRWRLAAQPSDCRAGAVVMDAAAGAPVYRLDYLVTAQRRGDERPQRQPLEAIRECQPGP